MHHPCDDVFSCAALPLDENGHVGPRNLLEALANQAHRICTTKDHGIRRNFADTLYQRTDRICH